jgi:hypothetical protein
LTIKGREAVTSLSVEVKDIVINTLQPVGNNLNFEIKRNAVNWALQATVESSLSAPDAVGGGVFIPHVDPVVYPSKLLGIFSVLW